MSFFTTICKFNTHFFTWVATVRTSSMRYVFGLEEGQHADFDFGHDHYGFLS